MIFTLCSISHLKLATIHLQNRKLQMKKKFIKRWLLPPGILDLFIRGKIAVTKGIKTSSIVKLWNSSEILENSNLGERCFIFGAGSSINRQDLRRLVGESVISVSNTFVHPDYANIKPKYHVLPPLQQGHGQMHSESNFVSWLAEMEKKVTDAAIFLHIGDYNLVHQNHLFKNHQIYWVDYCSWSGDLNFPIDLSRIPYIWSVSELAITVALYQGFSKIYLIGIDHDWFNGPLIYFFDHEQNNFHN